MRAITISRIMNCLSTIGVIATAAFSAMETPEATVKILEAEEENLSLPKTILKVAPAYKKTIISGTVTIALNFGSSHVLYHNVRAVNNAYKRLDTAYKQYRNATIGVLGIAGEEALRDQIARQNGETVEVVNEYDEVIHGPFDGKMVGPKMWFYEPISKKYFKSSAYDVMCALCGAEQVLADHFFVSVNELLDYYGFDKHDFIKSDAEGWSQDWMLDDYECLYIPFHFREMAYDVEHPNCYEIVYEIEPQLCYEGLN